MGIRTTISVGWTVGAALLLACAEPAQPAASPAAPPEGTVPPSSTETPSPPPAIGTPPVVAAPAGSETPAPGASGAKADPKTDANAAIEALQPLLMSCFESEFATNRNASGTLTFLVSVGPKGAVTAAEATKTTLAPATVACMKKQIRAAAFPARGFPWTFSNGYTFGGR
jgi:hypothetical protein